MSGLGRRRSLARWILFVLAFGSLPVTASAMEGKLGFGLVRLEPIGRDGEGFSGPGWGAGLQLTALLPRMPRMVAGVAGFEYVNLSFRYTRLSGISTDPGSQPSLRVVGQTNQYLSRFYIGSEIGPHGRDAFRPHAGANVALVFYGLSADVVPDVSDPGQSVSQTEVGEHRAALGYDVILGVDVNPWNTLSFDAGARFTKNFNVRQLAYGTRRIHPGYLEGYFAVAASLDWLGRLARD